MTRYQSIAALAMMAQKKGTTISEIVLKDQAAEMEQSEEAVYERMLGTLNVMRQAALNGIRPGTRSLSGMSDGDGYRMHRYAMAGAALGGDFSAKAIRTAVGIAEYNASMGKIVAAPTAGSCGILPAAVLTMMEERSVPERDAVMSLFTAGGVGMIIANQASISGAEGGCQAECGSAAAIAAAALVELAGGNPDMAINAAAIAIKNQLGLVCDPVAGLVEVPCIKRNAGSIVIAIGAADMALAGIRSVIPVDEVVSAMREVGESIPSSLRETAQGGLAATPTGLAIREQVLGA